MGNFLNTREGNSIEAALENIGEKSVVIHFNCPYCDDEQVTYEDCAEDFLEQLKKVIALPWGMSAQIAVRL